MTDIGLLFRLRRESLRLSQEDVAIKLSMMRNARDLKSGGNYAYVAHSTISRMENDPMNFKLKDLEDYAKVLGTSLVTVFFVCYYSDLFKPLKLLDLFLQDKEVILQNILFIVFESQVSSMCQKFMEWVRRGHFRF